MFRGSAETTESVRFRVHVGENLRIVLERLQRRGVIANAEWPYYYARLTGQAEIKAGWYELPPKFAIDELLDVLCEGSEIKGRFTIPEGFTRRQVRDRLAEGDWVDREGFDSLCDDTEFLVANGIPGPSCEGYLFPETYTFARGVDTEVILTALFTQWRTVVESIREEKPGIELRRLTTVASLVERETADFGERVREACQVDKRLESEAVPARSPGREAMEAAAISCGGRF